jgi:hypothetical protein
MRDTLKRRLRVALPLFAVAAALGLTAWLGAKFRKPKGPPDGDTALLVLVKLTGPDGAVNRNQLLRVPFRGGEPQPPEVVWEGSPGYLYQCRIVDGRFVVTEYGVVIDVWEKRELRNARGNLVDANSERVVCRVYPPGPRVSGLRDPDERGRLVAFDLKARTARDLSGAEAEPFDLSGTRAPDGMKSVSASMPGGELTLHRVGHAPRLLGTFRVLLRPPPPTVGIPPVLWLDDERFLTQDGNGNLIAVALDGTRAPVVTVPVPREMFNPPSLIRDPDGRIVYWCDGDAFFLDVGAKSWERCEWASLGHGFDMSWSPDRLGQYTVRYRGEEIGDPRPGPGAGRALPGRDAASTDGRLALVGQDRRVRVWSAGSGKWTVLDLRADDFIGWLK